MGDAATWEHKNWLAALTQSLCKSKILPPTAAAASGLSVVVVVEYGVVMCTHTQFSSLSSLWKLFSLLRLHWQGLASTLLLCFVLEHFCILTLYNINASLLLFLLSSPILFLFLLFLFFSSSSFLDRHMHGSLCVQQTFSHIPSFTWHIFMFVCWEICCL